MRTDLDDALRALMAAAAQWARSGMPNCLDSLRAAAKAYTLADDVELARRYRQLGRALEVEP
jgi:hypothetical protein